MFIWDFAIELVLGQIVGWLHGQAVGFLTSFFEAMGNMGAELFGMDWVNAVVRFFSYFAWSLYATGLAVSFCEFGLEYQAGRAGIKDTAMNAVKGFMAASLFSTLPVETYKMAVSLQGELARAISGIPGGSPWSVGGIAKTLIESSSNPLPGGEHMVFALFTIIMMGYCVMKVFFGNLKRGGILLIQIAVGSMHMFSIPRGYIDGFVGWGKQVIGICLTAFLQNTVLVAGMMVFKNSALMGLGLMLSAGEIPRIAGQFGLDTSTRASITSAVYATQQAVSITKTVAAMAMK